MKTTAWAVIKDGELLPLIDDRELQVYKYKSQAKKVCFCDEKRIKVEIKEI